MSLKSKLFSYSLREIINILLGKIGFYLYGNHINWIKTIYFNFRLLPFNMAIKCPIYIYSGTCLIDLSGKIVLSGKISPGSIRIGKKWDRSIGKTRVIIRGTLNLEKNVLICGGTYVCINSGAELSLKRSVNIRENVDIIVSKKVVIGKNTGVVNHTQIMDTDFHYTINTETRQIRNNKSEIIIGENNWIGSYTVIKKGTKTPNNTIVASSYSVLSKDYTKFIPENCIIGGIPAKLIATNYRRIFNLKNQYNISSYFSKMHIPLVIEKDIDLNSYCEYYYE